MGTYIFVVLGLACNEEKANDTPSQVVHPSEDTQESQETGGVGDTADVEDSQDTGVTNDVQEPDIDPNLRWDSSTSVLYRYGERAVLKGFSATTTEYLFDGLGMDGFWDTDFSTPFNSTTSRISLEFLSDYGQNNFSTIYENDMGAPGQSPEPQNVDNRFFSEGIIAKLKDVSNPVFRIPMTARYWLNGGKKVYTYVGQVTAYDSTTRTVTYHWGSSGVLVDGVDIVESNGAFHLVQTYTAQEYQEYITDLVFYVKQEVPDAVIILDLHWNFDRFGDSSTFAVINDETTDSNSYAKQLPMALDHDSTGSQVGSAVLFWESVAETFGYKDDELVDGVYADPSSTYTNHVLFSNNPAVDINYAKDIWFELYNEPHTDKFTGYTINGLSPLGNNDIPDGITASDWDLFINGAASTIDDARFAGMAELYEVIRERADNHVLFSAGANYAWGSESLVALHEAVDVRSDLHWHNVVLSVHPYMGYYQAGDAAKSAAGFYGVIEQLKGLQTPMIITEFGQYDGPDKLNFDASTLAYQDPDDNWHYSDNGSGVLSVSSAGNSNLYEWYHYRGYWDSASNTETGTAMGYNEAILQICEDHDISWSAWASRPNNFVHGSSTGATQPDVFTGLDANWNRSVQLTNPSTAINLQHQSQPMIKGTATGGGANWHYLWNRFAN